MKKIEYGQFYTKNSPFKYFQFKSWFAEAAILVWVPTILEPFAGANHLTRMFLSEPNYKDLKFISYDIDPQHEDVKKRDTIKNFPKGFRIAITNPPWLAKNSAKRKGIPFPKTKYDNLYKLCLEKMLNECKYVAAIVPATYIKTKLFFDRLRSYTALPEKMFSDTENPACLALFVPKNEKTKTALYIKDKKIGTYQEISQKIETICRPSSKTNLAFEKKIIHIKFNDKKGNLGLIAVDDTKGQNIKFVLPHKIPNTKVKHSSRHLVRIWVSEEIDKHDIWQLNQKIKKIREVSHDILFSPFKGLTKNGDFRRRIDFALVRKIIQSVVS